MDSLSRQVLPGTKLDKKSSSTVTNTTVTAVRDIEAGENLCRESDTTNPSAGTTKENSFIDQLPINKHKEIAIFDDGPIPDGGYGWVVVVCQFVSQMATWGMMSTYGVFLSWFLGQGTFPGSTQIELGWIAGIFGSVVFAMSPASNYLSKLLPLRGMF